MAVSKSALKALTKGFNKAKETAGDGDFPCLPVGSYVGRLSGEIVESNSSGRVQCNWCYEVTEGEHTGFKQLSYQGLDTDIGQKIFAQTLMKLEYDLNEVNPEDWPGIMSDISDGEPLVRFVRKDNESNGQVYNNVRLDKLLEKTQGTEHILAMEDDAERYVSETEEKKNGKKKNKVPVGSMVWFTHDGETVHGEVVNDGGKTVNIKLNDGTIVEGVKKKKVDILKDGESPF